VTWAALPLALLSGWGAPHVQAVDRGSAPSLGELAEQYRSADREAAVAAVILWTQGEVEAETQVLLEAVEARGEDATQENVTYDEETLLAAAGLLSDAALRAMYRGNPHRTRWELHAAARLVRAARSAESQAAFARRFYVVAGLMLHETGDLGGAHDMLSEGRRDAEEDGELLLALGSVTETIASLRQYELPEAAGSRPAYVRDELRFTIEGEGDESRRLPHVSLADAQALYVRALQADPSLLEARLHLGRVLLLREQPQEALGELERVWQSSPRPEQYYMARLVEGRARERLEDPRGAATALSAAAERMPRAQSALVALGRSLDRLGERTRAQEVFDRAMLSEDEAQRDPWLDYIRGQPERIEDLLEELRRLVP
jgi:tetratricopeptide (TPR) repeat protein